MHGFSDAIGYGAITEEPGDENALVREKCHVLSLQVEEIPGIIAASVRDL
jgi:hypothetical protein